MEEAKNAHIPFNKGGLFIAPRVILKVICWGDKIIYENNKISFSYICPVGILELPKGYLITKEGKKGKLKYSSKFKLNR